jgi:hypothetical protein
LGIKPGNSTNAVRMRRRNPRLGRKPVSLRPPPLPWPAIKQKCLPEYVAHVLTPLPSHVVAMCNGPVVTRGR